MTSRSCNCYVPPNPDTLSVGGSVNCVGSGSGGWCNGGADLVLTATDSLGHAVSFTGNYGDSDISCGAPCTIHLPEGQGDINYTGTCAGGKTASGTNSWKLDLTPPFVAGGVSGGTLGAGGWYLGGPVTLTCTGSDTLSGLHGISYSPQTANGDGSHTLTCTASDNAGNTAQFSASVRIDGTAPVISAHLSGGKMGGGGWYLSGPVSLGCNATDAGSGVAGVSYGAMTATATGVTDLNCSARDNAGNTSAYSTSISIDGVAPSLKLNFNGHYCTGGWFNSPVKVSLEAKDSNSGVKTSGFQVNGGPWVSGATINNDGIFTLHGSASDVAGNFDQITDKLQVDTTPPTTQWITLEITGAGATLPANDNSWVGGKTVLTGQSVDQMSGISEIYISTDDSVSWSSVGKTSPFSFTWDTTALQDGQYTLLARANDKACNSEHTAKLILNVDNTPPVVKLKDAVNFLGRSTKVFNSDLGSGLEKVQATISGNGIVPRVITFGLLSDAEDLVWDGYAGDGKTAPFGVYEVLVDVWDRVGNHSQTKGKWVRPAPQPSSVPINPPSNAAAPASTLVSSGPVSGSVISILPNGIPLGLFFLPAVAVVFWLVASGAAFGRDRRWSELRDLRRYVNEYFAQSKTNSKGEEEDD